MGISARSARPAVLVAACLVVASCGDDSTTDRDGGPPRSAERISAVDRAVGARAVVSAEAFLERPATIRVRTSAAPKQRVTVSYALVCKGRRTTGADYGTTPPDTRRVRLPAGARECAIAARAQLLGRRSGAIKITLLGRER